MPRAMAVADRDKRNAGLKTKAIRAAVSRAVYDELGDDGDSQRLVVEGRGRDAEAPCGGAGPGAAADEAAEAGGDFLTHPLANRGYHHDHS